MPADRIRVLVVDDSALMRRALTRYVQSDPRLELVGEARNGKEGLELVQSLKPDVVTLDIEMPEMDGLQALAQMRFDCPPPHPAVLMCSTLTHEGSHEALKALRLGAADVIGKNTSTVSPGHNPFRDEYLRKIRMIGRAKVDQRSAPTMSTELRGARSRVAPADPARPTTRADTPKDLAAKIPRHDLVVVGSSTGGPPAIERALMAIPSSYPAPIVIAQHMPAMFTKSLAERLDQGCEISVRHAVTDVASLKPGSAYLIVGGRHGRVARSRGGDLRLTVDDHPAGALYKPSVDVLFESAAVLGARALGVMLTGMGEDGVVGARVMRREGGALITQSEETCVVYGMPRAIDKAGLSLGSLDPDGLGLALALASRRRSQAA